MTGIGETTRDLHTLGTPHPAEHGLPTHTTEKRLIRHSRRALISGILTLAAAYFGTLTISILTAHGHLHTIQDPAARLYATLGLITLHTLGSALILIAGLERITRPMRTLVRQNTLRTTETTETVDKQAQLIGDVIYQVGYARRDLRALTERLDDVNARLAALEKAVEKIPDFAEGFSRGAYVTATTLGLEKER